MAGSLNKVMLIGNLGADPEIRRLQNGNAVASFSIATSESWRDKTTGERKEKTEWHRVVVWNEGLVKIVEQYVKKGDKLFVEGQLQTREWEKDGIKRHSTEVVLQGFGGAITMLSNGGRGDGQSERSERAPAGGGNAAQQDMNDEIPF